MNTIIEKIRAEVERLKQEIYPVKVGEQRVNRGPTSMESAALGALNTLMSRISTLQEKSEKPINQDDIDTEIGHWMDHLDDKYCMLVNHYSIQDIKDTARHFAQWQKEQMMENALHGWLDEDNEPPYDLNVLCEEKIPCGKFKHCDKVKLIIVKED